MNTKIILLNAPANTGKTKVMEYLEKHFKNKLKYASCKEPLHNTVMSLFGLYEERYYEIYNDRTLKETPCDEFRIRLGTTALAKLGQALGSGGEWSNAFLNKPEGRFWKYDYEKDPWLINLSLREAMIYVSEVLMKPRFGQDCFGRIRANNLVDGGAYIDDSTAAFNVDGEITTHEITPLIEKLGQDNILLIRIHREGFDFVNDSRKYVPDGVCDNTVDIDNVNEEEFYEDVYRVVCSFLEDM